MRICVVFRIIKIRDNGIYVFGQTVSGITICLLLCLIRYAITNPKNNHIAPYLVGVFSMLFSVLLNTAYCILGTDLIVPWNDSELLENSYDTNTMLEFTSLCIFLWHFSKLLLYTSFIYYLYATLSINSSFIKSFIYISIMVTILSIITLIYSNDDIYDIALTPTHQIQIVTQLKGYFFNNNINRSITLTEVASMIPLFTDICTLLALLKIYTELSDDHENQCEHKAIVRKHLEQCLRCIMLLFCASIPSWILYMNIFMKSSIVWMIIPYDQLINNVCLFLMYSENKYLYNILCLNCHNAVSNRWIPPILAPKHEHNGDNNKNVVPLNNNNNNNNHKLVIKRAEVEIVPSKSESMSKHKFGKKNKKEDKISIHNMNQKQMDGLILQLNTDDEMDDFSTYNNKASPPNDSSVFGQYLNVNNNNNKKIESNIQYNYEGKRHKLYKKNVSPSPSPSLSTSNIIKSIVMGNDEKSRRCKSYNTDYIRKRGIDNEIEESLQRTIEYETKITSETSGYDHDEKDEFRLSPLCITPSFRHRGSVSGIRNHDNDNDDAMSTKNTKSTKNTTDTTANTTKGSCSSSCGDSSSSSSNSCSSSSDEDYVGDTDTTVTVRRYLHRRSTIDLANAIQKELYEIEDEDEDDYINTNDSQSLANVGVPSFGHSRVHFSFFE